MNPLLLAPLVTMMFDSPSNNLAEEFLGKPSGTYVNVYNSKIFIGISLLILLIVSAYFGPIIGLILFVVFGLYLFVMYNEDNINNDSKKTSKK
jgi:hypothetical protein